MKTTKPQSNRYEDSVGKILDLRAEAVRALAAKVKRLRKRIAELSPEELQKIVAGNRNG
jgi:hypothetical protein